MVDRRTLIRTMRNRRFTIETPRNALTSTRLVTIGALAVRSESTTIYESLRVIELLLSYRNVINCIRNTRVRITTLRVNRYVLLYIDFRRILTVFGLRLTRRLVLLRISNMNLTTITCRRSTLTYRERLDIMRNSCLSIFNEDGPLISVISARRFYLLSNDLICRVTYLSILVSRFVSPPNTPTILYRRITMIITARIRIFRYRNFLTLLYEGRTLDLCLNYVRYRRKGRDYGEWFVG